MNPEKQRIAIAKACGWNLEQPRSRYEHLLDDFSILHATASQRAEAFLKTLGLWIEATKGDA